MTPYPNKAKSPLQGSSGQISLNASVISQVLGEYGNNAINNPEIALVAIQGEKYKVRMFRYDESTDAQWYQALAQKYLQLR